MSVVRNVGKESSKRKELADKAKPRICKSCKWEDDKEIPNEDEWIGCKKCNRYHCDACFEEEYENSECYEELARKDAEGRSEDENEDEESEGPEEVMERFEKNLIKTVICKCKK